MSEPGARPRRRRIGKILLLTGAAGVLLLLGLAWYVTTDSFQDFVRNRAVAELERITGGRVELGSFHTVPFHFQVEVRGLTVHGKERLDEIPYAHADRLVAQIKLISLLGAEFGFSSVSVERPVIHIILYPDGSTNQPQPKLRSEQTSISRLFALSIDRLEARHGNFLWNDEELPLDFVADDVFADMTYSLLHRRYQGNLLLGRVNTIFEEYRPLAWMVETHFNLSQNSIEVKSLKASSGRSHVEASGHIENFQQPKIDVTYSGVLDLAEVDAIARHPEWRRGTLQMDGKGSWTMQEFFTTGKLLVKDFDWHDESLGLRNASGTANYTVSNQRLALGQLQGKLLSGSVVGEAEVVNWLAPDSTKKTVKGNGAEQKGSIRLRIKDLSADEIAAALSTAARPFHRMNLTGNVTGNVDTVWKGSLHNAVADIAMDVAPPEQPAPGQLPLTAHGRATYRAAAGELEVAELSAATRATKVHASGTLSSRAALRVSLSTTDLSEWQPSLAALGYQERIPVTLQGHASFTGTASGKLTDIDFEGKLQSQDFDFFIPATSRAPRKLVHWDSLVTDIQLSPHMFAARNGMLRRGNSAVNFDITAQLQERQLTASSPFTARVDMRNADVTEVLAIAGYDYPVTGVLDLSLQAAGTRADPHGDGIVRLNHATFRGEPVQRFETKVSFSGGQISFNDILLAHNDAQVTGSGTYNFSTRAFGLDVSGRNFDLARFPGLQISRIAVDGRMDFEAHSSGTPDAPVINANIKVRNLAFDHEVAGDYVIDAVTKGSELQLSGHSQFQAAELSLGGSVHLRENWPANLALHFNQLDVDSALRKYLRAQITGHSATAGDLQLEGPLRSPGQLQVTGNISDFYADVEHIKVRNNGPLRFTVANQLLTVQQFRLIGEGTDLSVSGTAQLTGDQQLDLRANGDAGLQLLQTFNPEFTSSGVVTVDVKANGTISHPSIQGRLLVSGGSIAYRDLPSALSDINGSLVFNQDRLQVETLTAHVGGGLVSFGGYATAYNRQVNFDLTLQGRDVRLRYPPGVSSVTNDDLRWAGTSSASTLSGDVAITKLAVTPGFDFGSYLASNAQSSALPQTNPLLNRINMDVHITTEPELQMQTASIRLSGDADLRLRGTAAKPVLLGRADVTEGEVYFNGTKYRMERGDITFTNPVTTTPVLDLQAATHVRDYDITVNLNGEFDKLNLAYHSEPPLPTADIISLLALGQTQQASAQLQQSGQSPFVQQASSAVLAEALNSALSNRSQRLFGISHIKIDPQGLNTETSPTQTTPLPAVTIEQQVRDNITITYSTNVAQTSQQIIQGEYNFTRSISLVGIRDYNGVVSFEVRVRQRKK